MSKKSGRYLLDVPQEVFNRRYPRLSGPLDKLPVFNDLLATFYETIEYRNGIEQFDEFIKSGLRSVFVNITPREVRFADGTLRVIFTDLTWKMPKQNNIENEKISNPAYAIYHGITYASQVTFKYYFEFEDTEGSVETSRPYEGTTEIPIPSYCSLCDLRGKSNTQLHAMGVDTSMSKGYFVIDGKRFHGIINESVALSKIIVYINDEIPYCRLMVEDVNGLSKLTQLVRSKRGNIRYWISSYIKTKDMGDGVQGEIGHNKSRRTINIYYIFALLGVTTIGDVWSMLEHHIPEEERDLCRAQLISTQAYVDYEDTISGTPNISKAKKSILSKSKATNLNVDEDLFAQRFLDEEVVSFISKEDYNTQEDVNRRKIDTLIVMLARFLRVLSGQQPYSDRNAVNNKRYRTTAAHMGVYATAKIRFAVETLRDAKRQQHNIAAQFDIYSQRLNTAIDLIGIFSSSFRTSEWRATVTGKGKGQMSAPFDGHNKQGDLAAMMHTDISIKRENASTEIRSVGMNGTNFISAETPESKGTGLTKHLAMGVTISIQRMHSHFFIESLKRLKVLHKFKPGYLSVMLEGNVLGYMPPPGYQAYTTLRAFRRAKKLPSQLSISIQHGNEILLDISSNRLLHPMFILDETENVYIGDLRDEDFRDLTVDKAIELGIVEYIDPSEQTMLRVAERLGMRHEDDIQDVRNMIEKVERRIKTKKVDDDDILYHQENFTQALAYVEQRLKNKSIKPELREKLEERKRTILEERSSGKYDENYRVNVLQLQVLSGLRMILERKLREMPYTHALIDPLLNQALATGTTPFNNNMPPTRTNYQAGMVKQCLSQPTSLANFSTKLTSKTQIHCQPPAVITPWRRVQEDWAMGSNISVAISTMASGGIDPVTGEENGCTTDEDSFVYNQATIGRGVDAILLTTYVSALIEADQRVERPIPSIGEPPGRYDKLHRNGYPFVGAYIEPGDCILGIIQNIGNGDIRNRSIISNATQCGYVRDIRETAQSDMTLVTIRLEITKYTIKGDKKSPWCAQKGIIGNIVPSNKIPYDAENGMQPDVFMNPHSIVGRSTAGLLWEGLLGLLSAIDGTYYDGGAFRDLDTEGILAKLQEYGIGYYRRKMINPRTNLPYIEPMYILFISMQQLRHHINEKIQARGVGDVKANLQPVEGKKNTGGLRFGDMEKDAVLASGAAGCVGQRINDLSDPSYTYLCVTCGFSAWPLLNTNTQEIEWRCNGMCKDDERKVYVRKTPYSFVEFTTILSRMNVMIRLNTNMRNASR